MNRFKSAPALAALLLFAACGLPRLTATDYPAARRGPQFDDYFGQKLLDPYRWLEDLDSQKTARWRAAEQAFTAAAFSGITERRAIRSRLADIWRSPRLGLPLEVEGRLFYLRSGGLQGEGVLCVVDGKEGAPRVLIDPDSLSAEGPRAITGFSPSGNGRIVVYGLGKPGSRSSDLRVRDVDTGMDLADVLHSGSGEGLSWTKDGAGFFYSRLPDASENGPIGESSGDRLFLHKLGTEQSSDRLIFEAKGHPGQSLIGRVTDDGRYLVITASRNSFAPRTVYYVDLVDPGAPRVETQAVALFDKSGADFSFVGNKGPVFYLLTTLDAPRGKVVSVDIAKAGGPALSTIIPEVDGIIDQAAFADGNIVVASLHDAQGGLALYGVDGSRKGAIAMPGTGVIAGLSARADDPVLFFRFSSLLVWPSIFSYNLKTGTGRAFGQSNPSIDLSRFETRTAYFTSADGTQVPVILTARRGLKLDGSSAAWLHGCGASDSFAQSNIAVPMVLWLEMGGIYAQPCIRGSGGFGRDWLRAGAKEGRQKVFDDFTAAAKYLVSNGYTRTERLVIEGSLDGGLLVAAVMNQHPDLCAVALPDRGLMDMLRYRRFSAGASWEDEFGTSEAPEGFKYLLAYSPIHNAVFGGKYPAILVTTDENDERVSPAHSFKYAAALQAAIRTTPEERPALIRISSGLGYGGLDGLFPPAKAIDLWADRVAFAAHFMPAGALELPKQAGP